MTRIRTPSPSSTTRSRSPSPPPPPRSPSPAPHASASSTSAKHRRDSDGFEPPRENKRPARAATSGGQPPSAAELYQQQQQVGLQDTHSARHGDMSRLRTRQDGPTDNLDLLAHVGSQAKDKKGLFYQGPMDRRGLGQQPVATQVPDRNKSEHTTVFSQMTGGEPSSTKYQQKLGTADGNSSYEILHGMGHGEGGKKTQTPDNLASASHGANSSMIPPDKAISGNPDIRVDTSFNVRPGTHRAESVDQRFVHKDRPDDPIFHQRIDGDQPKLTSSQYKNIEQQVEPLKDRDAVTGAVHLLNLKDSSKP